jgi:hypothetical protein
MKNLVQISLIATAFVFAAGCASKPKPAPIQPTVTEVAAPEKAPVKKCKKHHKHCKADKLGQTSYEKDTAK